MNKELLSLLKDARKGLKSQEISLDYIKLYHLSNEHQIIPLIYNQIYSFKEFPLELKNQWKREAIKMNAIQTIKSERFLKIYQKILENELKVVVVKGIICRMLYPEPDNRTSNDEDLYVEIQYFSKAKEVLQSEGMMIVEESDDVTTLLDTISGLSIELHTSLFSKKSKAYGEYQHYFENAFQNLNVHIINGVSVYSLSYDLHLLFLITHFVKHFLHGGVGIRQILDIIMYSEAFKEKINWNNIFKTLKELNIDTLMLNVFTLAHEQLDFDLELMQLSNEFENALIDYQDLLNDVLDAGIFGKSSIERLHSSTMTLNAKETGKTSILKSVFPSAKSISGRYTYLKKYPFLLPIAWINRIFHYLTNKQDGNSQKTIEIGNQRIELLKKYKVIK